MPAAVGILFGAVFTTVVAMALGKLLIRALNIDLFRQEEHVFSLIVGAACLSGLTFALAIAGLSYKGVLLVSGLLILAIAFRSGAHRSKGNSLPPVPRYFQWMFLAIFAVYAALYFFNALAPEISPDGSGYHLSLVARYARAHRLERVTTNMYANLSQGMEMLFLFAFTFGRHSAAALIHFSFLVALPLAMLSYARRFGFPIAGVVGALLVFASPIVGVDGISAYNDVALACILFSVFYLLQIWDTERRLTLLILVGLMAGFAYAVKYTAALALPYALCFVAWKLLRARQTAKLWRPLGAIVISASVLIVPWLVRNVIWYHNPFSPFANEIFPNPFIHVSFEKEYLAYLRNWGDLPSRWSIPVEATVRGQKLGGVLGAIFLLAPIALLALRHKAGRQLLLAGLVFGLMYPANIGSRFLIPCLPFLSLGMGLALMDVKSVALIIVLAHAISSWPSILPFYCDRYAFRIADIPVKPALRIEPEDSWLRSKMGPYLIARMIEARVPKGAKVLSISGIPEAYCTRDILTKFQAASSEVLGDMLDAGINQPCQPTHFYEFSFPPQTLTKIRVVQTARGTPDQWSISEFRILRDGQELPRSPAWRLRASPNPWDVQLAFDNNRSTRWRSWQTLHPGMFIEVDFGKEEAVDMVSLQSSTDQYKTAVKLEGMKDVEGGSWITLSDTPRQYDVPVPPGLRRAAALEVKRRGVDYLLVQRSDFNEQYFRLHPKDWGITLLDEQFGGRLYHID